MSIAVIYWSGTGNTEAMAQAVEEGAKSVGAETILLPSAAFDASMVSQYDAIAFGCPAMGAEVLEESEFEPMFTACLPETAQGACSVLCLQDGGAVRYETDLAL